MKNKKMAHVNKIVNTLSHPITPLLIDYVDEADGIAQKEIVVKLIKETGQYHSQSIVGTILNNLSKYGIMIRKRSGKYVRYYKSSKKDKILANIDEIYGLCKR